MESNRWDREPMKRVQEWKEASNFLYLVVHVMQSSDSVESDSLDGARNKKGVRMVYVYQSGAGHR